MENVIVAQNCGESSTNFSAVTTADSTGSDQASPELKLPLRRQRDAPQDLDLVSWPPHKLKPLFGKLKWYMYDVGRGVDTYIYIIDNGINKDNAVRTQFLTASPFFSNTALGIQINAMAAGARRVALCLRCD